MFLFNLLLFCDITVIKKKRRQRAFSSYDDVETIKYYTVVFIVFLSIIVFLNFCLHCYYNCCETYFLFYTKLQDDNFHFPLILKFQSELRRRW